MAKRKREPGPIQDGEISLFDGMMRTVPGMPLEDKERLTRTFLLLTGVLQTYRTQGVQSPRSPVWRSKCPAQPGGIQEQWIMSSCSCNYD